MNRHPNMTRLFACLFEHRRKGCNVCVVELAEVKGFIGMASGAA